MNESRLCERAAYLHRLTPVFIGEEPHAKMFQSGAGMSQFAAVKDFHVDL